MDQRQSKALHIAATTKLAPDNGRWKVPSQTGNGTTYTVLVTRDGSWACSCPDHEERLMDRKHIMAVSITCSRESDGKGMTYSETVKITYSQNWTAYNLAQTNEKALFVTMLADLCKLVPSPPQVIGRPRMPLGDMAFATVLKIYAGCSSRRFATDMRDAEDRGLIEKAPNFNTLLKYMREPVMTDALTAMLEVSSLPLRAVETQFAVDSSGFGTSNMHTWFSIKHGREITQREWRKVHAMCGTSTHIVTATVVTPNAANDAPLLPELLATTAGNFPDVQEVSADKGYLSKTNCDVIEKHGAMPLIPFKSNSVEPPEGSAWARMEDAEVMGDELAQHLVGLPFRALGEQAVAELGLDHGEDGLDVGAAVVVGQEVVAVVGELHPGILRAWDRVHVRRRVGTSAEVGAQWDG